MNKKPIKRNKPIRKVSTKRAKEMKEYAKLRKEFLEENPVCGVWLHEFGWIDRGDGHYEKPPFRAIYPAEHLLAIGAPASTECHHRAKRGKNYLNVDTWLAVSSEGHRKIEEHKSWARSVGLLENI